MFQKYPELDNPFMREDIVAIDTALTKALREQRRQEREGRHHQWQAMSLGQYAQAACIAALLTNPIHVMCPELISLLQAPEEPTNPSE